MISQLGMLLRQSQPLSVPSGAGRRLRAPLQALGQGLAGSLSHISLRELAITAALLVGVLISAIGVVYSSHLSRDLIAQQAVLQEKSDAMQSEWVQLLLEQSAWSTPTRVERIANDKLQLVMPGAGQVQLIY